MTTAPLGGANTGPSPTDRGKSGVKRSVLTEGHGIPIKVVIEGANRHEVKLVRPTIEGHVVERRKLTVEQPRGDAPGQGM